MNPELHIMFALDGVVTGNPDCADAAMVFAADGDRLGTLAETLDGSWRVTDLPGWLPNDRHGLDLGVVLADESDIRTRFLAALSA